MRWSRVGVVFVIVGFCVLPAVSSRAETPSPRQESGRSASQWASFEAKLTASDAADADRFAQLFGCRVVEGDTAIIGSYLDDNPGGTDAGAAYVFTLSGGVWTEQQKLRASDAEGADYFGGHVVVADGTAFISASSDDHSDFTEAGSVYVFTNDGGTWSEQQKLTASDAGDAQRFGWGLAVDGDTLAVGSQVEKVYVFTRIGNLWVEGQILTASDGQTGDGFSNVALLGDTLAVGAGGDDSGRGAVYVFARTAGVWTEQQKLTASDGQTGDVFGGGVAVVADMILASAAFNDHSTLTNPGAGYVFTRTGDTWTQEQKLTAAEPATGDLFGYWLAAEGTVALIGAAEADQPGVPNAGAAHVFSRVGDTWYERAELAAYDPGEGDMYGGGVALSGDTAMVGALLDDLSNPTLVDAGSAYVYRLALFADDLESGTTLAWSATVP